MNEVLGKMALRNNRILLLDSLNNEIDHALTWVKPVDEVEHSIEEPFCCTLKGNQVYQLQENDIVQVNSSGLKVIFRSSSLENILVLTNQCNNNCIFCPDPETLRQRNSRTTLSYCKELISLLTPHVATLCITGGEPTLLKTDLFEVLDLCKTRLPNTEFLMLSNGRMFCYQKYAQLFSNSRPSKTIVGIPLHSHISELHDNLTRAKGSFDQTVRGLFNLIDTGQKVEIRVVINRSNYRDLQDIALFIGKGFPGVLRVNFMSLELSGNAYLNREKVWVSFEEVANHLAKAVIYLVAQGIGVRLYNFPLCYLPSNLWQFAVRSISQSKIRYTENCQSCDAKELCGGFFSSTLRFVPGLIGKPIHV